MEMKLYDGKSSMNSVFADFCLLSLFLQISLWILTKEIKMLIILSGCREPWKNKSENLSIFVRETFNVFGVCDFPGKVSFPWNQGDFAVACIFKEVIFGIFLIVHS
jgi:hypothetical protein